MTRTAVLARLQPEIHPREITHVRPTVPPTSLGRALRALWRQAREHLTLAPPGGILAKGEYAAFISYRHAEPDRRWAVWLHDTLETFRIPRSLRQHVGGRQRFGRIFLDEEELAASPHLSAETERALDRSSWLVVVCSPRAKASAWINSEVEYFKNLGRSERVLALLIEGEPDSAFPESLYSVRSAIRGARLIEQDEPLAADVRPTDRSSPRRVRLLAKLRLAATMLGCTFDDLRQRDQERLQRRLAWVIVAAFVGLTIVSGLAVLAEVNRRDAVARRREAQSQESLLLANMARQETASGNPVNGMLLAIRGLPSSPTDVRPIVGEAVGALLEAHRQQRESLILRFPDGFAQAVAFSPDGKTIATTHSLGPPKLWERVSGTRRATLGERSGDVGSVAFSHDSRVVATGF